ncbi:hypothetical protein [Halobacillus sp. Marseille-P3879]|uniref:hypothetical protein n=1 Tax=Halobacillus sp. Marseille-P3879 TaxID=2045014 RepID=UPI000C7E4B4E|nr:hypothetical protein [Halobacillus sp. Marseille-P3879]
MKYLEEINQELDYLSKSSKRGIIVNTTAKQAPSFRLLPRRAVDNLLISTFMISEQEILKDTLEFFDGKVDYIFIDIEQKQEINLFKIAKEVVQDSKLVSIKPNDITLESCDLLLRNQFSDNLYDKNIIIIGTGNLASKVANRLAERQASVHIIGRSKEKELKTVKAINLFLPKYNSTIKVFDEFPKNKAADIIISFLSGEFKDEKKLLEVIDKNSFIVDGGINNFSEDFINEMLINNINITRLDTRIAIPYQMLLFHKDTKIFFKEVYGKGNLQGIPLVSGGFIGDEGSVIVDNINLPEQVIGIADGKGGLKSNEQLTERDENNLQGIREAISISR